MEDDRNETQPAGDPLIDEVRAIRRAICEKFGNDVDRLCEHLWNVEREYRTRTGRFANVPRRAEQELFPESAAAPPHPGNDEARSTEERGPSKQE